MKREPIFFVLVLAILGLMAYQLTQEKAPRASRQVSHRVVDEFVLGSEDPVAPLLSQQDRRDLYRRPSADEPLLPLSLPDPPMAFLAELLPPPLPDSGPAHWSEHLFVRPPQLLGGIEDLVDTDSELPQVSGGNEEVFAEQDQDYKEAYDWLRLDPLTTLYGHILGEDRYDLAKGDALVFQEVNPRTGAERFGQRPFTGEEYEAFGFAQTLRNSIELGIREQRQRLSAARVEEMRAYVGWLLDQALAAPMAFDYADELARACIRLGADELDNWLLLGDVWEARLDLDRAFALFAGLCGESLPLAGEDLGLELQHGRFAHRSAPRVRMGMLLRRFGLDDVAERQLVQAANLEDGDPLALMELGRLYLDQGKVEEGHSLLARAMTLQGRRSSMIALDNALALGSSAMRLGQWEEASSAYAEAERAAGGELTVGLEARLGVIASAYCGGDFQTAADMAEAALVEFGSDADLLYLRGLATGASGGSAAEVVRDLRAAAAARPFDAAPALSALAFWLNQVGETEAAHGALADALELSPRHFYSLYLKAHWAGRDGDSETARPILQDLVRQAPDCAGVLAEFSQLLYVDQAPVQAEVAHRRLSELYPEWIQSSSLAPAWADLALRRGLNFLRLGEQEEALARFDLALALDDKLVAARNAKAMAYYAIGDFDACVAEFAYIQAALRDMEEDPQFVFASVWQQRVEEHAQLRRWKDDFSSKRLRAGWDTQQEARAGVEPMLSQGRLTIRGKHSGAATTSAYRTVPGMDFREFQGSLAVGGEHKGKAGLSIGLRTRSKETWNFRVYRDREGLVAWSMLRGSRTETGNTSFRLAEGSEARIRFQVDREQNQPVLTVWFEEEVIYMDAVSSLRNSSGRMACGIWVETSGTLPVNASLDDVEMIYARP